MRAISLQIVSQNYRQKPLQQARTRAVRSMAAALFSPRASRRAAHAFLFFVYTPVADCNRFKIVMPATRGVFFLTMYTAHPELAIFVPPFFAASPRPERETPFLNETGGAPPQTAP